MICLFSDLDNTLIYSHRVDVPEPKIIVEYLNGRPQSYMTLRSHTFFAERHDIKFVPVTTRSIAQFGRVERFWQAQGEDHALVSNGAILLVNGVVDESWHEDTLKMIEPSIDEMREFEHYVRQFIPKEKIHWSDEIYLYASAEHIKELAAKLSRTFPFTTTQLLYVNRKMYCFPKVLDKGRAICRYRQRFDLTNVVCAGDSIFDVPMLNQADIAVTVPHLSEKVIVPKILSGDDLLSDTICSLLNTLETKEKAYDPLS